MPSKYTKPNGSLISFFSDKVKKNGGINLAQGIPGYQPPIELLEILSKITKDNIHQYAPGNGNSDLINLLAVHYKKYSNFNNDNFLIVNGATEAISLIFVYLNKIISKPFSVLAFDPAYETYKNLPDIFESNYISFPLNKDLTINFDSLEKTIISGNVKIIIIGSPGNPLCKIFTQNEFQKLISLSKKYNFYIIIDAVYKDLYYNTKPYIPIDLFNERMFYVNSFSKIFSITGWRIGYLVAHNLHIDKIKSIHDYTGLCAPSILQKALVEYIKQYNFGESYVSEIRTKLKKSYSLLYYALIKMCFEAPETYGGYFIWAKLPAQFKDGFKFAIDLYDEQKVAIIPGIHFSDNGQKFVRFNIARNESEIIEAISRINNFVNCLS